MITKTIFLKKGECALDAIASLKEDSHRAWIYIDTMCYYNLRRSTPSSCNKDQNQYRVQWKASETTPQTFLWMYQAHNSKWFSVEEILADDIAFKSKPLTPDMIFFITNDYDNKLKGAERLYVPEDKCPIDFIKELENEANGKTFIFPKYLVSKIAMGRMKKTVSRNGSCFYISWDENGDFMRFSEICNTHMYMLIDMNVDNFIHNHSSSNIVYLV